MSNLYCKLSMPPRIKGVRECQRGAWHVLVRRFPLFLAQTGGCLSEQPTLALADWRSLG